MNHTTDRVRRLVTDHDVIKHVEASDALSYAFSSVRPTDALMASCYEALANAGVEPLPVRKTR